VLGRLNPRSTPEPEPGERLFVHKEVVGNELSDFLSSVGIPIVLLGRDGRIRGFAAVAAQAFGLRAAHVGRPLSEVNHPLARAAAALAQTRLTNAGLAERMLQDGAGRWFQLTARPYVTLENQVDGAVITAFDIDAMKKAAERVVEAQSCEGECRDVANDLPDRIELSPSSPPTVEGAAGSAAEQRKPLSPRECEVLQRIAAGKSSKQIATSLGIGVATVETHRRQLMDKLRRRTIAELTKYAIKAGLTSLD
jgi:PAS domain S-box-containing protein